MLFPPDSTPNEFKILRLYPDNETAPLVYMPPRIIIRDEYTRASDYIVEAMSQDTTALLITGQPGIGKSVFLWYLLALRLSEQKPTILSWSDMRPILYTDTGVYKVRGEGVYYFGEAVDPLAVTHKGKPLILIDGDASDHGPPNALVSGFYPHVHISSPNPMRYKKWTTQLSLRSEMYIMNPWRWSEIVEGLHLQKLRPGQIFDMTRLRECFDVCGPVPRHVYTAYIRGATNRFQNAVGSAVTGLTAKSFTQLMKLNPLNTNVDALPYTTSHVLTLWWRPQNVWHNPVVVISSRFVMAIMARYSVFRFLDQQRELILLHSNHSFSAVWAGWLFENFAGAILQAGGVFPLVNLYDYNGTFTSTPPPPSRTNRPYMPGKDRPKLLQLDLPVPGQPFRVFDPKRPDAIKPLIRNTIYLPTPSNNPAFDAVIIIGSDAVAFQMTLQPDHGLSDKCLPILKQLLPTDLHLHFILVVPDGIKDTAQLSGVSRTWSNAASFYRLSIDVKNVPLKLESEAVYA